ncbi:hypothetical protein [Cardiobacterium valvarum]|uniref:Uncharacterized protein n=1 Tax=Cardiobacterium valvarum F0432 TaxID=797473 RepID=G9ZJB0_9GAMM|nr:hypothetical protein [Cardiobacterium valvarum]EHM50251.1 hypothetical protein HMPREF9080_02879 [Cardiobacterium valvarum F0432]
MDDLNSLIMLVILLVIACVGIFILFPNLADSLSEHKSENATDDYYQRKTNDVPPYHTTVGGWSSGGSIVKNSTNNYGNPIDD